MNLSKKTISIIIAIFSFLVISLVYFSPLLQGKQLRQHDVVQFKGGAQELIDFREKTGEHSLWTNSMFSGMPSYLVTMKYTSIIKLMPGWFGINHKNPHIILFACLIAMFVALLVLKIDIWLSVLGAIFYAFSSYYFIILEAGHITKAIAMIYMPLIVSGVYLTYNKKLMQGATLFAFSFALQLAANHVQITYYTGLLLLIFLIFVIVDSAKKKQIFDNFVKPSIYLAVGVILAIGANFAQLYHIYDYGKESMRGKSELTANSDDQTSGLDKSYATAWSYGIDETLTLLIPNFKGGSSSGSLSEDSNVYNELKSRNIPNAKEIVKGLPLYWGTQSFTSGPVYVGAIVFFLFVLGLFVVKGRIKWWLLGGTLLSIILAWGSNFMFVTDFFLDYFPGYNKFRTVSMILVIAELTMPLLAIFALHEFITNKEKRKENIEGLKYSLYITGGLLLLLLITVGGIYDFSSSYDAQLQASGWPDFLIDALREDRKEMLTGDIWRALFFVTISFVLLFANHLNKLKYQYMMLGFVSLALIDMWSVNKRYLNNDDFMPKSRAVEFQKSPVDNYILQDTDPHYRVLNLTTSTFNDASTSYYHKSIGGYHGAKLSRYQELIENHISMDMMPARQIQQFIESETNKYLEEAQKRGSSALSKMEVKNMIIDQMTPQINQMLADAKILNMLNTKYYIIDRMSKPILNTNINGNAWFVNTISFVENADKEIEKLGTINPKTEAIIDKRYENLISNTSFSVGQNDRIELLDYKPNHLTYKSNTASPQLAIFSEIFYEKGWEVLINGEPVPHFRANYVLRGMEVPKGENTIEFIFKPDSYKITSTISVIFSFILLAFLFRYIGAPIIEKRLIKKIKQ